MITHPFIGQLALAEADARREADHRDEKFPGGAVVRGEEVLVVLPVPPVGEVDRTAILAHAHRPVLHVEHDARDVVERDWSSVVEFEEEGFEIRNEIGVRTHWGFSRIVSVVD